MCVCVCVSDFDSVVGQGVDQGADVLQLSLQDAELLFLQWPAGGDLKAPLVLLLRPSGAVLLRHLKARQEELQLLAQPVSLFLQLCYYNLLVQHLGGERQRRT